MRKVHSCPPLAPDTSAVTATDIKPSASKTELRSEAGVLVEIGSEGQAASDPTLGTTLTVTSGSSAALAPSLPPAAEAAPAEEAVGQPRQEAVSSGLSSRPSASQKLASWASTRFSRHQAVISLPSGASAFRRKSAVAWAATAESAPKRAAIRTRSRLPPSAASLSATAAAAATSSPASPMARAKRGPVTTHSGQCLRRSQRRGSSLEPS
mmetsp:Transcript_44729/g.142772  ORF Transcript_44729/g.142772 Transcript_44729/m.142772 type:complete len:210 (-) Transcript_44729:3-632(-)